MPPESETQTGHARAASGDELKLLVHEASEETLLAVLENPNLKEEHVTLLLERLDLSANVLSAIGGEGKWIAAESVRVRLARHPRTPKRTALAMVRQLYLFDLLRLSLLPSTPADIRRAAEEAIVSRVPHLPVGEKLTLARRGPSRVAGALLAEGQPQATKLALANPFLTESQVLKVLAKPGVAERVVAAIARHPRWSRQYEVRMALLRNGHAPVPSVLEFLPDLKLRDLKEISTIAELAAPVRKYVVQEMVRRAKTEELPER
ncbi:MAG: hypothetical protein ABSE45_08270 [Candidatus Acidiferrales bacterium]|jgi:hypothetical protein